MGNLSLLLGSVGVKGARNETIRRLMEETNGVTAIEYGLIAALIAFAAFLAFTGVGTCLSDVFNLIAGDL